MQNDDYMKLCWKHCKQLRSKKVTEVLQLPLIVLHILKILFQGYTGKENTADLIKI